MSLATSYWNNYNFGAVLWRRFASIPVSFRAEPDYGIGLTLSGSASVLPGNLRDLVGHSRTRRALLIMRDVLTSSSHTRGLRQLPRRRNGYRGCLKFMTILSAWMCYNWTRPAEMSEYKQLAPSLHLSHTQMRNTVRGVSDAQNRLWQLITVDGNRNDQSSTLQILLQRLVLHDRINSHGVKVYLNK